MALTSTNGAAASNAFVTSVNIFATALNTVYYTVPENHYLEGYVTLNSSGSSFKVVLNGVEHTYNLSTTYQGDVPKPIYLDEGQTLGTGGNSQYWCFSGVVRSK